MPNRKRPLPDATALELEIVFLNTTAVPAHVLVSVLENLNRLLHNVEQQELHELEAQMPEVPSAIFDAVRYRMNSDYSELDVTAVRSGSLVLAGVAVAAGIWLLEATLGETFKEAWKETSAHKRLKELLGRRIAWRASKVVDGAAKTTLPDRFATMSAREERRGSVAVIVITVVLGPEGHPLSTVAEQSNVADGA
jgi:hypothetical protein